MLAPGGELHISDVYCDRRLPPDVRSNPVALGECLGGAAYLSDFLRLAKAAGFVEARRLSARPFEVRWCGR